MTAARGKKRRVVLVTGLSGAGLSTALKALEDLGYKAVDNLPVSLLDALLRQKEGQDAPVAVGIDCRAWDFDADEILKAADRLRKNPRCAFSLVFMDCQDQILQQRFTETRRVHPLAADRPVADGVLLERRLTAPLRKSADLVLDTTDLKAPDLRRIVAGHFRLEEGHGLLVFVTSFGFRNGVPREADLVFDVRFLDNPHWDPKLRPMTGQDAPVAAHIRKDPAYETFFRKLTELLDPLLPRYYHEGKNYLTIAVGCTGGKHRSVFTAEELFRWLDAQGYSVALRHRDLDVRIAEEKPDRKHGGKRRRKA